MDVEHLTSALKSAIKLKPLRVWTEESTRGALLLSTICELIVSLLITDMEPEMVERTIDGKRTPVGRKPSSKALLDRMVSWNYAVGRGQWSGFTTEDLTSSEDKSRVLKVIDRYIEEGPLELIEPGSEYIKHPVQWKRNTKNTKIWLCPLDRKSRMSFFHHICPHRGTESRYEGSQYQQ